MNKQAREDGGASVQEEQFMKGTPQYLAPEILLGLPHNQAVDWWAFGVMVFEFVNGYKPFDGESPEEIFREVISGNIRWPLPPHDQVMSAHCKGLVVRLLENDPEQRLTSAVRVKAHPFFGDVDWLSLPSDVPPMIPQETLVSEEDTSAFKEREEFFPMPAEGEDLTYLTDMFQEGDEDSSSEDSSDEDDEPGKKRDISFSNFWHVSLANLAESGKLKRK